MFILVCSGLHPLLQELVWSFISKKSGATDSESDHSAQTPPCPSLRLLLLHSALTKFIGVHLLCPGCADAGHCLHPCLTCLSSPLSLPGSTSITSPEGITASTSHTPPPLVCPQPACPNPGSPSAFRL